MNICEVKILTIEVKRRFTRGDDTYPFRRRKKKDSGLSEVYLPSIFVVFIKVSLNSSKIDFE
jgi:hypothetical protein